MNNFKEPLKTVLKKYCHIECYDPELIKRAVVSGKGFPYDFELFKEQLRDAIDQNLISPSEYEQLTEEDFDSRENLNEWLEELLDDLS
ncbi:hypothetical protein [Vibrio penaeicida]|uniref:Uncharacterized protein n=1 Tax=Vibrio penaeicida TaxID=104609 RepID=A0AAV5NJG0_9VIBR|nr:hypothetical protein [Vibrio penaeicida]RTZ22798.1 hypothetical protein EKN09_12275 [Vibrio penaeicida]GLQ70777.1 hypothetical protein GCM10007932_01370 [Vibrio penaeicida]